MKYKAILLAIAILLNCIIISGCPSDSTITESGGSSNGPTLIQSQSLNDTPYTTLGTPFNGNGEWYMTQAFGAYLHTTTTVNNVEKDIINGYHTGEDWNYASKDGDKDMAIFPIAPGHVIDHGPVINGDKDGLKSGFYLIIKHEGRLKIPSSNGAHLLAMREVEHEKDRASNGGASMIKAKDLFGYGVWKDYDLGENDIIEKDGQVIRNGNYSIDKDDVTIYSIYMHINNPATFVNSLKNMEITPDMMDKQIGTLMPGMGTEGGMSNFYSHLHFEIRVGAEEDIKKSVIQGDEAKTGGYFHISQEMVDTGYREPTSIIQANAGQTIINGQILGTETSIPTTVVTTPPVAPASTTQATTATLVNETAYGIIKKVYVKENKYYVDIDYVDRLTNLNDVTKLLKENGEWPPVGEIWNDKDENLRIIISAGCIRNINTKIRTFEISNTALLGILSDSYAYMTSDYRVPDKALPAYFKYCVKTDVKEFMKYCNDDFTSNEDRSDPTDSFLGLLFGVKVENNKIVEAYETEAYFPGTFNLGYY